MDNTVVYVMNVVPLNEDAVFEHYFAKMQPKRQEKIMRFKHRMDQNRSLGAGILLARGLLSYGIEIKDVVIRETDNGKPYFAGGRGIQAKKTLDYIQGLSCNLSHSKDYAAAVFGPSPVGIDIEHRRTYSEQIVRKCFCEEEQEALLSCKTQDEREDLFLRYWTIKESAAKVSGLGMRLPFSSIRLTGDGMAEVNWNGKCIRYFLKEYIISQDETVHGTGGGYRIAVCGETACFEKELIRVEV